MRFSAPWAIAGVIGFLLAAWLIDAAASDVGSERLARFQTLFTGLAAIVAASIAYAGVAANLAFHERQAQRTRIDAAINSNLLFASGLNQIDLLVWSKIIALDRWHDNVPLTVYRVLVSEQLLSAMAHGADLPPPAYVSATRLLGVLAQADSEIGQAGNTGFPDPVRDESAKKVVQALYAEARKHCKQGREAVVEALEQLNKARVVS